MAGLFSDTSIPPWMQDKESPVDYFLKGQQVGSQIAGNIFKARNLEMQAEENAANVSRLMAETELKKAGLEQINQENVEWMSKDAQTIPKWMATPLGKLDATAVPEATSKRGMALVDKRQELEEKFLYRQGMNDVRKTAADNALERARIQAERDSGLTKRVESWENARDALDDETYATLDTLPNSGRMPNGMPQPEARRIINQWRTDRKMPLVGERPVNLNKPLSGGGKAEADLKAAIEAGESQDVIDRLKSQAEKESAGNSTSVAFLHLQQERDKAYAAGDKKTGDERQGRINKLSGMDDVSRDKELRSLLHSQIRNIDRELLKPENNYSGEKPDASTVERRKQLIYKQAEAYAELDRLGKTKSTGSSASRPVPGTAIGTTTATAPTPKPLTPDVATDFLNKANGDRNAAEKMAKDAGYTW